jgi:hypothetical protein
MTARSASLLSCPQSPSIGNTLIALTLDIHIKHVRESSAISIRLLAIKNLKIISTMATQKKPIKSSNIVA